MNTLPRIDRAIWKQLVAARSQKKNGFKTMIVATINSAGLPDARTVVLREADESRRLIWFHTDVRADKVAQLDKHPDALLLFWDSHKQIQLRCRARTTTHTDDLIADEQWAKAWEGSRKMYLSEYEPGSVQPDPYPGFPVHFGELLPTRAESEAGRPNFAVVECKIVEMEYLHLSRAGQTRAQFQYEENDFQWLAP